MQTNLAEPTEATFDRETAEDVELMHHLTQHRPNALQALYRRHRNVLHSIAMRVLHDEKDTEEVLQDVFLQLWQHAERYSELKGKPLGWLITLARRRAIDRVRQRAAYQRATERFETQSKHFQDAPEADTSAERNAGRADLRAYLEQIMNRLPPAQKDVIERAFFRGMSQREIAASTQLPLGTVKTRIELALRKLSGAVGASRHKIA